MGLVAYSRYVWDVRDSCVGCFFVTICVHWMNFRMNTYGIMHSRCVIYISSIGILAFRVIHMTARLSM